MFLFHKKKKKYNLLFVCVTLHILVMFQCLLAVSGQPAHSKVIPQPDNSVRLSAWIHQWWYFIFTRFTSVIHTVTAQVYYLHISLKWFCKHTNYRWIIDPNMSDFSHRTKSECRGRHLKFSHGFSWPPTWTDFIFKVWILCEDVLQGSSHPDYKLNTFPFYVKTEVRMSKSCQHHSGCSGKWVRYNFSLY